MRRRYGIFGCPTAGIVVFCLVISCQSAGARNYYVRPPASIIDVRGETGKDWTTAFNGFPDSKSFWARLQPGDTIYFAGGVYPQHWDVRAGGTGKQMVVITRATRRSHGTDKGWNAAMDQAAELGQHHIHVLGNHLMIDGQRTDGIQIRVPPRDNSAGIIFTRPCTNVVFRNISIEGPGVADTHNTRAFDLTPSKGRSSKVLLDRCRAYDIANAIYTLNMDSVTVQNSEFTRIENAGSVHENVWYAQGCHDCVFRWNTVSHSVAEGVFLRSNQKRWAIYGNLFRHSWYGVATKKGYVNTDILVFNNTFVDVHLPVAFKDPRDEGTVRNNLFYPDESGVIFSAGIEHDYNWYGGSSKLGESNGTAARGEDPFVNRAENDFRLRTGSSAINSGAPLNGQIDVDMEGTTRGSDGTWDVGALEHAEIY